MAEDRIPESASQEISEYDRAIIDDVSNDYLQRRQAFGVINSPAFKALESAQVDPPSQENNDDTEEVNGEDMPQSAADMYLDEKFPSELAPAHTPMFPGDEAISALTGEAEPTVEEEFEAHQTYIDKIWKPVLRAIGINLDADKDKFEEWFADFEAVNGRPPEFEEVPEDIWQLAEFDNAEIPLDAPKKLVKGGVKEAIELAAKKADDVLGYSDKPLFEILQKPGVTDELADDLTRVDPDAPYHRFAGNINFGNINSSEDAKALIDGVATRYADDIDIARRGVVSHEETSELADLVGMTPERLLARRKGEAFNAHEALAARQILVSSAEELSTLAQKVASGTADTIDRFAFRKQLATHYALQAQVSGMTAEAGRALNAFKIGAGSTAGRVKAIKEMMETAGRMDTDTLARMMTDLETPEQVGKFVQKAQKAKTFGMLMEAWINGLLSGPQTHAVNTLSNSLVALWMIPERMIASAISKVPKLGSGEIAGTEALHQAYGLVEGFKDGLKAFGRTIKTGEPSDILGKLETGYEKAITAENVRGTMLGSKFGRHLEEGAPLARAVDLMGEIVRMPGRFLEAEDGLFKAVGYMTELRTRAIRQAHNEGLRGRPAARRINEILQNPETHAPDIHMDAIDMARYQTFTNQLGPAGTKLQGLISHHPMLRLIMPFVRTPTNILKFAFERTPLAPLGKQFRAEIMAGGARRDMALAKLSMGSMIMAVAATMAAEGKITGGGPSNKGMRNTLRNKGWQPYSVKVGDKYYAYGRLEPIGMMLGLAADAAEIMGQTDEMTAQKIAAATTMSISKNMTSKTWLRGLSEAINAIDDPNRYGEQWWKKFAGTAVPTGVAQIERTLSPEMSATYSWMDQIKSRIPGYSDDLPPRRNVWGEPIVLDGGWGPDMISPIYTSTEKYSPIDDELLRLEMPKGMPKRKMSINRVPIELNPQEYDDFVVAMNKTKLPSTNSTLKKSLDKLVKTRFYRDLSDDNKKTVIRRHFTEARMVAQQELLRKNPELRAIIEYGLTQGF